MPEKRLAKTRRSLPEGYQFGDESLNARMGYPFGPELTKESREVLNIWDRNSRRLNCWNVIEADEHGDEWAV